MSVVKCLSVQLGSERQKCAVTCANTAHSPTRKKRDVAIVQKWRAETELQGGVVDRTEQNKKKVYVKDGWVAGQQISKHLSYSTLLSTNCVVLLLVRENDFFSCALASSNFVTLSRGDELWWLLRTGPPRSVENLFFRSFFSHEE